MENTRYYAILDENDYVTEVITTTEAFDDDYHIELDDLMLSLAGRWYNRDTGEFDLEPAANTCSTVNVMYKGGPHRLIQHLDHVDKRIDGKLDAANYTAEDVLEKISTLIDQIGKSIPLCDVSDATVTHRNSFRGKNLGAVVTEEQKTAIRNGTFDDLWLGDYWEIGGIKWRIADIDYWYNCGDVNFTRHHLVIMPDTALYLAQMNETNSTTGGYTGSKMYTTNLSQAKALAASAFGNMILLHREFLVNAVTDGMPSAGAWVDSTIELPNEIMMYGCHVYAPANNGSVIPVRYTTGNSQLALMAACPKFIKTRETYWLRDVVSANIFADVSGDGVAASGYASFSLGVRPVFAIG